MVWAVVLVGVATTAASCGTSAPGADSAFCADADPLAAALRSHGASEVAFLIANESTIEDLGTRAPHSIKRDTRTFLTGVNDAMAQSDAALANTPAMDHAAGRIKSYCGIPR